MRRQHTHVPFHNLNLSVATANTGTVSGAGRYHKRHTVSVSATPASHYHFVSWSDSGAATHNVTMGGSDISLTATFAIDRYSVSVSSNNTDMGTVSGGATYDYGASVSLSASPKSHYHFVNWTEGGTSKSTANPYTFTLGDSNRTFVGNFAIDQHTLTVNANNSSYGTVTPSGTNTYNYGTSVEVDATPSSHYHFVSWSDGGAKKHNVTVDSNKTVTATFAIDTHTISVGADTGGSATGGGEYNYGSTATLTATASTGYHFVKWSDNNTSASRTITVTGDAAYTAYFAKNSYKVTASTSSSTMGNVTGGGTYQYQDSVSLTATANSKYHFVNWTEGSTSVSTSSTYTFTLGASDRTFVGNFDANTYNIAVAVASGQSGWGTVSGSGTVVDSGTSGGTTRTITATANSGYRFVKWNDDNTSASRTVSATGLANGATVTYTATFVKRYTITLSSNDSSHCTLNGGATYDNGATATISCSPATGYHFNYWTNPDGTTTYTNSRTITVTGNATYTANISIDTHTVSAEVLPANTGSVSGTGTYNYGSTASLTATGATGYHFDKWDDGTTSNTKTFIVREDVGVIAHFELNSYTITGNVASASAGRGTVSGGGSYLYNSSATLTATPNSGYSFAGWTDGNTSNPRTFTVTGDATYTATFSVNSYTLTLASSSTTMGSVSGGGSKSYGSSVTATATANSKYHFTKWTDTSSGAQQSTNSSYTFTMPANNVGLTAKFEANKYNIAVVVASGQSTWGGVSGGGTVVDSGTSVGTSATITATPADGYHFLQWQDGNTSAQRTVSATGLANGATVTYTATFIKYWTITPIVNPIQTEAGSVSGGGDINEGVKTTISASAASGYRFNYWVLPNDTTYSTDNPLTITSSAESAGTYTAKFIARYTLTLSAGTGGSVSPSGTHTYDAGDVVAISATANSGYRFLSWSDGGAESHNVTMDSNKSITASFQKTYEISASSGTGGTVSGYGTYDSGATCTLRATSSDSNHYHFKGWYKGETLVSSNSTYQFTVTSDGDYRAVFTHGYTVNVHQQTGGTITGGDWYSEGSPCTLDVSTSSHYRFVKLDGPEEVFSLPYTFTVLDDSDWEPVYQHQYYITVTSDDRTAGTTTGGNDWYDDGKLVDFNADPSAGYRFLQWSDGSIDQGRATIADADKTFTASFLRVYTVRASAGTGGQVKFNGGSASSSISHDYDTGSTVTIVAVPNSGYVFYRWSDGTTNATKTITNLSSDVSLTATFASGYTITGVSSNATYGSVTGGGTYLPNTQVTLTANAVPNTGAFVGWSDGVLTNPRTVTATGNATYTANFEAAGGPYKVYVQNDQPYGYTVLDSNVSTDVSTNISSNRYVGTLYTAGANPLDGYVLDKIRTFSDTGTYITAHNTSYDLHHPIWIGMLILGPSTAINYLCNSTERTSSSITIDGQTYNGYGWVTARNFDAVNAWYYGVVSDFFAYRIPTTEAIATLPGTVSVHAKDYRMHNVSAVYHQMQYKLADGFYSVMARTDSVNGTVSGSGAYYEGQDAVVKVDDIASGYTFAGWYDENGNLESNEEKYIFQIQENRVLTASFVKAKAKVSASASPSGSGTFTGTGTYDVGTTVTLTAIPATGYQFSNWSDKVTTAYRKVELTTAGEYTFTANFTKLTYNMKATTSDKTMGTASVTPSSVEYGGSATFTATAYDGYEFTGWSDGNTSESYTVKNITSDITLTAKFKAKAKETALVSVSYLGTEGPAFINGEYFGEVKEAKEISIGEAVELRAEDGFLGWYLNDKTTLLSKDNDFSYIVTGDCTILAYFK